MLAYFRTRPQQAAFSRTLQARLYVNAKAEIHSPANVYLWEHRKISNTEIQSKVS